MSAVFFSNLWWRSRGGGAGSYLLSTVQRLLKAILNDFTRVIVWVTSAFCLNTACGATQNTFLNRKTKKKKIEIIPSRCIHLSALHWISSINYKTSDGHRNNFICACFILLQVAGEWGLLSISWLLNTTLTSFPSLVLVLIRWWCNRTYLICRDRPHVWHVCDHAL